jgi:hypothetical protein
MSREFAFHLRISIQTLKPSTHSCLRVKRWEEVPNEEIVRQHGVVYDSPDPNLREEVDLDQLPHRHPDTRRENNIYDETGRRIPRLHGKSRRSTRPCGLLINLSTITELFSSYIPDHPDEALDQDAYAGEPGSTPSVSVYPQAFLRTMGHIQCDSVLPHFAPFISDIRRATSRRPRVVDLVDDQPLPDEYDVFGSAVDGTEGVPPVIIPSACQFYNEISHRIRPSAALHDVQQGRITSALAGAYGNAATKYTHNARIRECKNALPHQKYDNKISLDDVPRALRLENIYIIQCDSIKPEKRNGMSAPSLISFSFPFAHHPFFLGRFIKTSSFLSLEHGLIPTSFKSSGPICASSLPM